MTADALVLAIDQGSSSTKALLVSTSGAVVSSSTAALAARYPHPGWVEQSPIEIVDSVLAAVAGCLAGQDPSRIATVGLSTQRESLVLWETASGDPVSPVISWQDQRNAELCDRLGSAGYAGLVRERSGLPLDPMFSATRAQWLLDEYDPDRSSSRAGRLRLGTVDSWLLSRFSGSHLIEIGNASRTQLLDIRSGDWDPGLLELFDVPAGVLGRVTASTGPFPGVRGLAPVLDGTPIGAVMGDSHAALFAHGGWAPGIVKATYGTGSSVMGRCAPGTDVGAGLCLTIAWDDGSGPSYAVEGNIRSSGSTLAWLARTVGSTPAALAELAAGSDSGGVVLVPAFNGLGAPWWDRSTSGTMVGLTLGSGLPQLARAALESIVMQVEDVLAAVDDAVAPVNSVLADGGAAANDLLMQLQADLSDRNILRATDSDLSALGAAHLAGRQHGVWTSDELGRLPRARDEFVPALDAADRAIHRESWRAAVDLVRGRSTARQP